MKWKKHICILAIFLLIGSSTLLVVGKGNAQTDRELNNNGNGNEYETHKLTREEMLQWKEERGVRKPGESYNHLVNGHGTGLAPPTNRTYEEMVGNLTVVNGKGKVNEDSWSTSNFSPYVQTSSADLSDDMYFPSVGDQGTQGSCTAWATTYYTLTYEIARARGWDVSDSPQYRMSPAWTFNKVNFGTDGSAFYRNMHIAHELGGASLAELPYDDSDYSDWGDESAWREAPSYRINGKKCLTSVDIQTLKTWIDNKHPIPFSIDSDEYDDGLGYNDNVISSDEYSSNSVDHANTIVGYDDAISEDGDTGAFKVVNSWGGSIGDNGYYWLTYNTLNEIDTSYWRYTDVTYDGNDEPSRLATWEFSDPNSRNDYWAVEETNSGERVLDSHVFYKDESKNYPSFMCVDISPQTTPLPDDGTYQLQASSYINGLETDPDPDPSTISSYQIEWYDSYNENGNAHTISCSDVPKDTRCGLEIDLEDPWVNIYYPKDGYSYDEGQITIKWNGGDGDTSIDHYELQIDDGTWRDMGTDESYTYTFVGGFWYDVTVKAYDYDGNTNTDTVTFYVEYGSINSISP